MTNRPASDEVVIIWVEWTEQTKKETLVLESPLEVIVRKDFCAISGSTSGDDKHAAIYIARRSNFKVVALEVEAADEVPETFEGESSWLTNNTLI